MALGQVLGGDRCDAPGAGGGEQAAVAGALAAAVVLVDYAMRYPEAVPLRTISKSVAQALFKVISWVGILKDILTDQGTSFMSRTLLELNGLLGIKSIWTSVYRRQTDGLVERLNKALKSAICKFVRKDDRQHPIEIRLIVAVHSRPYWLPEHKTKVVQKELAAMREMKLLREPDGTIPFRVGYREVSDVSQFDAYATPRVKELLDWLGTALFFTILDLTMGYWQIPLSPGFKEKTAFSSPYGLYQFIMLPLGLSGAPATFQCLMERDLPGWCYHPQWQLGQAYAAGSCGRVTVCVCVCVCVFFRHWTYMLQEWAGV